ncbi:MAG: hypothetical protein WBG73_01900 [Coleofasciculaceae cyanobacterium]
MAIYLDEMTRRNEEATGIPMSAMMLQATIEKYLGDSEALLHSPLASPFGRSADRTRE